MRSSKAKRIRKEVYGDISYRIDRKSQPGEFLRKKYQAAKKERSK